MTNEEKPANQEPAPKKVEWDRTGACRRCGKCCTTIVTHMPYQKELQDYLEWVSVHKDVIVQRDKGTDIVWIEFKNKCKYLRFKQGKAVCRIYDNRPTVCRKFPLTPLTGKNCPGFTFTLRDPAETP